MGIRIEREKFSFVLTQSANGFEPPLFDSMGEGRGIVRESGDITGNEKEPKVVYKFADLSREVVIARGFTVIGWISIHFLQFIHYLE